MLAATLKRKIQALSARPWFILLGALCLSVALGVTGILSGLSAYSADSWSYFELSKSVFSADFYRFNTYRSYFSPAYSASFPLGYPVLLALAHLVFGQQALLALGINIVLAVATWLLVIRLARQLGLSLLLGWTLACSLVLFPFYLDEVFSGRAMPAAMLLFLAGAGCLMRQQHFGAGLLLGLSALVRFDYLVYALLFQAGVSLAYRGDWSRLWRLPAGFLAGISPWVVYSLFHFGKVWVSDNSWVALSAFPAFVLDFPAAAGATLVDQPSLWLARVTHNLLPLAGAFLSSALSFPLLVVLVGLFIVFWSGMEKRGRRLSLAGLALVALSALPYLLTGYFDARYFSLPLFLAAVILAWGVEPAISGHKAWPYCLGAICLALAAALVFGGRALIQQSAAGMGDAGRLAATGNRMAFLRQCQASLPGATFIFVDHGLAAAYGAQTGLPAAMLPSNFPRMGDRERARYFSSLQPFVIVNGQLEFYRCRK